MRVLHLVKTSDAAKWALLQMRELARLGVEVHAALPPGGKLLPRYREAGVAVHEAQLDLPVRKPWRIPATLRALRRLVAEAGPDLVHSHFVGTTIAARLALGRRHPTPRIFQVPGPLHMEHFLSRRAELLSAGGSDYWIGSCRHTCEAYRRAGIGEDRLFLSYYGTDVEELFKARGGVLRGLPGVDANARLIGMVAYMYKPRLWLGRTRGIKGHEDLIDAAVLCLREAPSIQCVFVGGAWGRGEAYERRVRKYAERKLGGRAVFLGTRSDVPRLYPDFDVAVHPSHSENVGGAAESLLLGVPTIATNVGGFPDVVIPGQTGYLVPPRDPESLAASILNVLSHPDEARALAADGSRLLRGLFDVRRTASSVLGIYRRILDARG